VVHVLLGARLLLAAVFATAAAGKLLDVPGSRKALTDFGVPARAAVAGGLALPLAELVIAVALVPSSTARWAAAGALALLLAFIAAIAAAMRRGEAPDCHCFGQIQSAPAGRETLVRNAILAAVALVVVAAGPGPAIDEWVADRSGDGLAIAGLAIAAVLAAAAAAWLWSANRGLRRDLTAAQREIASLPAGLPVGLPAPTFRLSDIDGRQRTLESLCARGRDVALIFASPGCSGCRQLLPDIGRWQSTLADRLTIAVVSNDSADRNRPIFAEHRISDVMLQRDIEVMSDYRVRATPCAVLIDREGRIASAPAAGAVTIESLVRIALRRDESELAIGAAALEAAAMPDAD
jgi:uncharacterized membrane protein YphA (DoxX/SURF4 family)